MFSSRLPPFVVLLALGTVSACTSPSLDVAKRPGQAVRSAQIKAPPGAPDGTCWDTEITPALIETITRQEILQPAVIDAAGKITTPAVVRTVTRQDILRPRTETWFQTLCPAQMSPDTVATLQRALSARGHYKTVPTGGLDRQTRAAIRRYQLTLGLDSDQLSLENARKLGLIAVDI